MRVAKITDRLSVASQPSAEAFQAIALEGFAAVVNARPDGEEAGQPGNEAEAASARDAGLAYSFIPVKGPTISEGDIRAFQDALSAAGGPVLAHCKSGTRALVLHVLGEVLDGRMKADEIEGFGDAYGFDLSSASGWLIRRATQVL